MHVLEAAACELSKEAADASATRPCHVRCEVGSVHRRCQRLDCVSHLYCTLCGEVLPAAASGAGNPSLPCAIKGAAQFLQHVGPFLRPAHRICALRHAGPLELLPWRDLSLLMLRLDISLQERTHGRGLQRFRRVHGLIHVCRIVVQMNPPRTARLCTLSVTTSEVSALHRCEHRSSCASPAWREFHESSICRCLARLGPGYGGTCLGMPVPGQSAMWPLATVPGCRHRQTRGQLTSVSR